MSDSRMTLECPVCPYRVSLNDSLYPDIHDEHRAQTAMHAHVAGFHPDYPVIAAAVLRDAAAQLDEAGHRAAAQILHRLANQQETP